MKWDSYEDFENKYGSDNNPESYAMRLTNWTYNNNVGVLLKQKLLNENAVYDTLGSSVILSWAHWEPVIREQRRLYMGPNWMEYFEFSAERMKSIQKSRGLSWEPPATMLRYVPEK